MTEARAAPASRRSRGGGRLRPWSVAVLASSAILGFLVSSAANTADGTDLRPAGGDVASVLSDRAREAGEHQLRIGSLQDEIDRLSGKVDSAELASLRKQIRGTSVAAGLTEVTGTGVRIELSDAPRSSDASGINPNLLVVHQQDIQAFVNALWAGGAEAIAIQGRRIVATTGIKCVGSTVVLDGVPYSPPYVIEAIGSSYNLTTALDSSPEVATYTSYAENYGLGLTRSVVESMTVPAHRGLADLQYAQLID